MDANVSNPTAERRQISRRAVRRGIPLVLLLLVILGAYIYWQVSDAAPTHEAAAAPQSPVPVSVLTVRRETVPVRMRFLGQTEGSQVVEVRARVAGHILSREFTEGQLVTAGQTLFQIDPRPFEVELAQAKAGLASTEATLAQANSQVKRHTELRATGASSSQELEDWQTQAQVAAARGGEQRARMDAAKLQIGYATIKSAITGRIGRAEKDVGSYVDAGQNGLLAVVRQVDPMYVRYSVTEQEILDFRRRADARQIDAPPIDQADLEITLSDGSTYAHRGRINFVDVQVDVATGTAVVRGQVPNPEDLLKPGQFVHANILGVRRVGVVRVPQRAVNQSPIGASVMVVNDRNVVETRPVTLGEWSGDDNWIVEQGLNPGDRVVIDRLMTVRPGMTVTPRDAPHTIPSNDAGPTTSTAGTRPATTQGVDAP